MTHGSSHSTRSTKPERVGQVTVCNGTGSDSYSFRSSHPPPKKKKTDAPLILVRKLEKAVAIRDLLEGFPTNFSAAEYFFPRFIRQHEKPRFGHCLVRKMAGGQSAPPSGMLLDFASETATAWLSFSDQAATVIPVQEENSPAFKNFGSQRRL